MTDITTDFAVSSISARFVGRPGSARDGFRTYERPAKLMSMAKRPLANGMARDSDGLGEIVAWFLAQESARERFRWVLRDSLDQLFDGARTGRWAYQQLSKTEKAHLGTVVEINLTKEFGLSDGEKLDWSVAGVDLDCKFSKDIGGWEIPMEMYVCADHEGRSGEVDHPAMLVWMSDDSSEWAVGVARVTDDRLRWTQDKETGLKKRGYNSDNKRKFSDEGARSIYWLWGGTQLDLPENTLLQMDDDLRRRILQEGLSGQARVNALFTERLGVTIRRPVLLTVAQQDDAPKRARDARKHLSPLGILVLGHQEAHPSIAMALGLPAPAKGEWLSVQLRAVSKADSRRKVWIDGSFWSIADVDSCIQEAPRVPRYRLEEAPVT